jgi:5-methylcytosine-specific restriction endonuclease McrA
MPLGSKERILEHFKKNVGTYIPLGDIRVVSGVNEFARQIRLLRQEGWDIEWKWQNGSTCYVLKSLTRKETGKERIPIDNKTRYRILQRDNSTCRRCGRTPSDAVKLTIDHKIPVEWGGSTTDDNLWTLCRDCNEGKQAFYSDFDAETMKAIAKLDSGNKRLQEFIRRNYGKQLHPEMLLVVSRTREWTRQVRKLRQEGYFDYKVDKRSGNKGDWTYTFTPLKLTTIEKENTSH